MLIVAVAAGAGCLFLVQPLIAKLMLPAFGGGPEVWAVCLVFFQTVLLAGYLYADAISRRLPLAAQGKVHAALALAAIAAVWAVPSAPVRSVSSPSLDLLLSLAKLIGLPYLLLASTSPLLQYWHAELGAGRSAYRLYAWSNLASIAALLAYPLLLEPNFGLSASFTGWKTATTLAALLLAILAFRVRRQAPAAASNATPAGPPPGRREIYGWLLLAFLGSAFLLTVTNHLCRQVAPFPFLWAAPLLVYLLTFVIAFARDLGRGPLIASGIAGIALLCGGIWYSPHDLFHPGATLLAAGLFAICLFCHGLLAEHRPEPRYLTAYYFVIAFGGALGSVFVAFAAPRMFTGEYELGLVLAAGAIVLAREIWTTSLLRMIAACAVVISASAAGLAIVAAHQSGTVATARGFYGAIRIADRQESGSRLRIMLHGATIHGSQWLDNRRTEPSSYYGPSSGAARAFEIRPREARTGIIGLGAGALAAWARPGDTFRFYEIDPWVVALASSHFSYMNDSAGRVEVVLGDARVSLENQPPQAFDLLFVDAFSGDSIPVHLLTREAFTLFRRHMAPGGVLAFHVSSRSLDLTPVVRASAESNGWAAVAVVDRGDPSQGYTPSVWMLAGPKHRLRHLMPETEPPSPPAQYHWSDDSSSLLHVLRHAARR